jgi:hypothetical protein
MKNKIKYEMFLNRKKFNVINWIKSNGKDYQKFCSFLESRNVMTPGEEYFDKALYFYTNNILKSEIVEKEINVVNLQNKNDVQTKSKKEEINLAKKILELKELTEKKEPVKKDNDKDTYEIRRDHEKTRQD